jgi:hypothetical protein
MERLLRAIFSRKARTSSRFSDFIRKASSAEKKKIYTEVLKKATERQNDTVRKARAKIASDQGPSAR